MRERTAGDALPTAITLCRFVLGLTLWGSAKLGRVDACKDADRGMMKGSAKPRDRRQDMTNSMDGPGSREGALEEIVDWVLSEPTAFVVGSGVSRDYPSSLPTAWEMLRHITLRVTVPPGCPEEEIKEIASALPELYYEALTEFTSPRAALLWKVLIFGQTQ